MRNTAYKGSNQGYSRRDFLKLGGAAGAAGLTGSGCAGLKTVGEGISTTLEDTLTCIYKTAGNGLIAIGKPIGGIIKGTGKLLDGTGKFLEKWADNGINNYESLDVYVYGNIGDRKRLDAILYGIGHFLPHYVGDIGKAFQATFVGVPDLAMEKAKEQKAGQYGPDGPSFIEGKGPIEGLLRLAQGAYIATEDTARWLANYAGITANGFIAEVTQKPLDTAGKAALTIQIIDLASNGPWDWAEHGHDKGGFQPLPPAPPFPPGGGSGGGGAP